MHTIASFTYCILTSGGMFCIISGLMLDIASGGIFSTIQDLYPPSLWRNIRHFSTLTRHHFWRNIRHHISIHPAIASEGIFAIISASIPAIASGHIRHHLRTHDRHHIWGHIRHHISIHTRHRYGGTLAIISASIPASLLEAFSPSSRTHTRHRFWGHHLNHLSTHTLHASGGTICTMSAVIPHSFWWHHTNHISSYTLHCFWWYHLHHRRIHPPLILPGASFASSSIHPPMASGASFASSQDHTFHTSWGIICIIEHHPPIASGGIICIISGLIPSIHPGGIICIIEHHPTHGTGHHLHHLRTHTFLHPGASFASSSIHPTMARGIIYIISGLIPSIHPGGIICIIEHPSHHGFRGHHLHHRRIHSTHGFRGHHLHHRRIHSTHGFRGHHLHHRRIHPPWLPGAYASYDPTHPPASGDICVMWPNYTHPYMVVAFAAYHRTQPLMASGGKLCIVSGFIDPGSIGPFGPLIAIVPLHSKVFYIKKIVPHYITTIL